MTRGRGLVCYGVFTVILLLLFWISSFTASAKSGLSTRPRYEGPMVDAHAHATQWSSDWTVRTLELYHQAGVYKVIFFDGEGVLDAYRLRPSEIVPSFYVYYMNRTSSITDIENALKRGFIWIGEALLRHWGETNTAADDPVALRIYDLCAKYRVPITVHQDSNSFAGAYEELERALKHNRNCIFAFHGWWMGSGHLSMQDLEKLIVEHPNLYVELAGQLESSLGPPWTEQTFLGGTQRDVFAYPDGRIREEWRNIFEKYPSRFINGFDLFTQSAYRPENLKIRIDYWRNLLGQINQDAAQKIAFKNVENLLQTPWVIPQANMTTLTTWTGATGEDRIRQLLPFGNSLYAALFTSPGKVVKINLDTMTTVSTWTATGGDDHVLSLASDGAYIYAGLDVSSTGNGVVKIDPRTMTSVSPNGVWKGPCVANLFWDGKYLYAGLYQVPARVVKIDTSTMTTVSAWTGATGEDNIHAMTHEGTNIYVGLWTSPAKIVKINSSTMSRVAAWTGTTGQDEVRALTCDGKCLYAGLHVSPGKVVKIDLATMMTVSPDGVWAGVTGDEHDIFDLALNGRVLYAASSRIPGRVVRIVTDSMSATTRWTGATSEDNALVLALSATYLYAGLYTTPAKVIKILDYARPLSDAAPIFGASTETVFFVGTGNIYDDSALGFYYSKCTNRQNIILQTNPARINQTTGQPLLTGIMVLFGGRLANKVTRYYEDHGLAMVHFSENSTHFAFMKGATVVFAVAKPTYNYGRADYFVMQVLRDGSRMVFLIWGIAHTGTYASGIYFADVIYSNFVSYTESYYICKWTDLNNDGIQQSNEITVVASGS